MTPSERILVAAEQIFNSKGFRAATVREICRSAGVNLAAVNYYFGDKAALYRAVVRRLMERVFEGNPLQTDVDDPEVQLAQFVRTMLNRLLAPGGLSTYQNHSRLLARELVDPSPVLDAVVEDFIRPQAAVLTRIIQDLVGGQASMDQVWHCAFSIIGQCIYYGYAWPVMIRLHPMDLSDPDAIDRLAGHVVAFSLYGLRNFSATGGAFTGQEPCPKKK